MSEEGRRLDRATVLAAALELVDAEGLELLTIRRLADRLGVRPMALYRHARDKDDLLDGLTSLMYEAVDVDVDAEDWQAELLRFAHAWRRMLLSHPQVIPLVATRPLVVPLTRRPPAALDLIERVLALLDRAGISPVEAVSCYKTLASWLIGELLTEARVVQDRPADSERAVRLGLQHLPVAGFPHLRGAADELATPGGKDAFEAGLLALLAMYRPAGKRGVLVPDPGGEHGV